MRMSRVALVFCIVVTLVWSAVSVSPALACSSPARPGPKDFLTLSTDKTGVEIAIQGRVVQTDYYHQNSIVQVQQYFKGGPVPEYLLLQQIDPPSFAGLRAGIRGYGDCVAYREKLYAGDTIFTFLYRLQDGSYSPPFVLTPVLFRFPEASKTVKFVLYDDTGSDEREFSIETFAEYLVKQSGIRPVAPSKTESRYPLQTPLLITTSKGTQYIVSVDWKKPVTATEEQRQPGYPNYSLYRLQPAGRVACFAVGCTVFSPNGLNTVRLEKGGINLTEWGDNRIFGQGFLISTTSEVLAVWNRNQLEIYSLSDSGINKVILNSVSLNETQSISALTLAPNAVWSADGRMLAYSDANGLWLWDVYSKGRQPRLLSPAQADGAVPYGRHFSLHGRYLAIIEGNRRSTLDLISEARFPDGLVSPNERILLAFDTSGIQEEIWVCHLAPVSCNDYEKRRGIKQAAWKNDSQYLFARCDNTHLRSCTVYLDSLGAEQPGTKFPGYAFDYDPVSDSLVVLKDKTTITINGEDRVLRPDLDGDIVSVRWLQSLFIKP